MDQLRDLADDRLLASCIYCGGLPTTRDHVPSRVFLDQPFPENIPVVGACSSCNVGFSQDEAYVACLIESAVAGSTDPDRIRRPGVSELLRRTPALRARIDARVMTIEGVVAFGTEQDRLQSVALKLARGHAAYELSLPCREKPTSLWVGPLGALTPESRESFDAAHVMGMFGEVGSRGMQRALVTQVTLKSAHGELSSVGFVMNDWVEVQEGRYRYLAIDDDGGITVKIVIGEYLACEVVWQRG